jgi:hypothetical protein
MDRARALARRVGSVEEAWLSVLGRRPTPREAATADRFLKSGGSGGEEDHREASLGGASEGVFRENTAQERLLWTGTDREGDVFTVEAVFSLESIDRNAAVRTLVSRWNGGKESVEGFGWSLGVTGVKSGYTAQTLLVQLVGEDENSNLAYEVVPSRVRIELGHRYAVAVNVSCVRHQVTFRIRDLSRPSSRVEEVVVWHSIRQRLGASGSPLVIGGLARRAPAHQWDGRIEAVRISEAPLTETPSESPLKDSGEGVEWSANHSGAGFRWEGVKAGGGAPRVQKSAEEAFVDLCQILMNSNEFFYLH